MASRTSGPAPLATAIALRVLLAAGMAMALIHLLLRTELYATALVVLLALAVVIADLARLITAADTSMARMLDTLADGATERPLLRFAGSRSVSDSFERAAARLRAAQMRQRQAVEHLQSLLDTVAAALIVVGDDGKLHLANRAAQRLAGESVERLQDVARLTASSAQMLATLPPGARRIVRLADGGNALVTVARFEAPGQPASRLIAIQRIAGELDAVELKAWSDVTRVLAHEMMNSLTPISSLAGSLESLLRDTPLPPDASGALEAIRRRSSGLMEFVDRYRKVAELPRPRLQPLDLAALLAGIEQLMRPGARERGIDLRVAMEPATLSLHADPQLLEQAIINLLRNAIDAVAGMAEPRILLTGSIDAGHAVLRVEDNGRGLDDEDLALLFVPFYTRTAGGSGVGLSLASQIAVAHSGRLEAGRAPGGGAIFTLHLPLATEPSGA